MTFEKVVFYILLIDSLLVNLMVWSSHKSWYRRHLKTFSILFPLSKGWSSYYLLLVMLLGYILWRNNLL